MPGASDVLRGAVLAYATALKTSLLGVPEALVTAHGVVSGPVAEAMAAGVRERLGADWGLSTTGVAGPGPDGGLPAGTVHVGIASAAGTRSVALRLPGDRALVRERAVGAAWDTLRRALVRQG